MILFATETAVNETNRRREKQMAFNKEHNITPKGISKAIPDLIQDFNDLVGGNDKNKNQNVTFSVDKVESVPELIETLRKKMLKAADDLNFEEAAALRDKIHKLEEMMVQDLA